MGVQLTRKGYESKEIGRRDIGRHGTWWLDGCRSLDAKVKCLDSQLWMHFLNDENGGMKLKSLIENTTDEKQEKEKTLT